ncbi:MAG: hypothetical protein DWQ44_13230 [Bacteroidetes bacterium]|nr:MAG: hypothetical protein DWQ33_13615 [Bacteroidota bacterium]REK05771.1 MAG: hypothetical protein DWQ39_05020 [Bacteroidota bacterium]REK31923.1 MAG: hypothetical protein DWQ44_13230 [Bacteroidota bacterium]REK49988.1 MAG: hypothetical protein DWQ48_05450 [Bacteroidota bacterium]
MLDGPLSMEEKKFMLTNSQRFLFKSQFNDSDYVNVDTPVFLEVPLRDEECDHTGNQAVEQVWRFPGNVNFIARFEHYNGEEYSKYLLLKHGGLDVFSYNIFEPNFHTIEINTQFFHNTMIDSTTSTTLSPSIRKIWYGKHTGILKYEEWNGRIWDRQKAVN